MPNKLFVSRSFPTVCLVALLLLGVSMVPHAVLAQEPTENTDDANTQMQPSEPTPLEDLTPSDQGGTIPGTEPLYDKGVTITEVQITGNKLVPADTILKAISEKPGTLYSKQRLQSDLKKIYDTGYFTEHLRAVPIATREGVHVRFEVEENTVVNAFTFSGETVIKEPTLAKIFANQVGMPQNVNQINQGIQSVEQLYKDQGYILARVDDIQEDPPGTVKLIINEGIVHKITYSGNKKTKGFVIRRAMAQKVDEVYNEKVVADDLKRIFSTQSFSDVRRVVKASPEVPGQYDLVIEVDEKKTGSISLGGGVDTGTGIYGSIGYNEPNFLGRGQNFSTVFSVGSGILGSSSATVRHRVEQLSVNWFNPSIRESSNSVGISGYARELASFNVPLGIEDRFGAEVDFGRPFESNPNYSMSIGFGAEDVHIREGADATTLAQYPKLTTAERSRELTSGVYMFTTPSLAYDSRNNRFNPTQGWLNTFGSRLALSAGSTDSYGTVVANLRRYLKVSKSVSFAVNAQAAGTMFGNVPDFNQFRFGGPYTIRGFQEGGVGIGKDYILSSAELRSQFPFLERFNKLPLYDMLQVAIFEDSGELFGQSPSNGIFGRPGYGIAVGAGLRLNLPALGPIRVDFAKPLSGNTGGQTRFLNFGVGQKF